MYALIRSLFRDLQPLMIDAAGWREQTLLLEACRALSQQILLSDAPEQPARSLFLQVRHLFPADSEELVLAIIDADIEDGEGPAETHEPYRHRRGETFSSRKG